MKPRSAKNKGARLQKWVAEQISILLNIPVDKDGDIESRPMGQPGVDVILRGQARKLFLFSIECENAERWDIHNKIKQAKSNQMPNTEWLCFFKRNKEKPIIVMDAEVFFKLYKKLMTL